MISLSVLRLLTGAPTSHSMGPHKPLNLMCIQAHKEWDFVDTFTEDEKGRYTLCMIHVASRRTGLHPTYPPPSLCMRPFLLLCCVAICFLQHKSKHDGEDPPVMQASRVHRLCCLCGRRWGDSACVVPLQEGNTTGQYLSLYCMTFNKPRACPHRQCHLADHSLHLSRLCAKLMCKSAWSGWLCGLAWLFRRLRCACPVSQQKSCGCCRSSASTWAPWAS